MNIDIDLCLPYREYENRHKIFDALLDNIEDGMTFTLTPSNIATGDHFLIFSAYKKQTITIHTDNVPYWIDFDGDEPMLLENCPTSFFRTLLININEGNYTIKR